MNTYPNIEKLARLIDWTMGVIFSLVKLGFWLLVLIFLLALILR